MCAWTSTRGPLPPTRATRLPTGARRTSAPCPLQRRCRRSARSDSAPDGAGTAQSSASTSVSIRTLYGRRPHGAARLASFGVSGTLIARDLRKAHGAATILAGVSVTVAPGDVLGVVGPNGAGKSTLLRLLAGVDKVDGGDVRLTSGTAGYLPQEPDRAPGERLHDYLARRTGVGEADARVHAATEELAADASGSAERYGEAFEEWLALGGADLEQRAERVMRDLGLDT